MIIIFYIEENTVHRWKIGFNRNFNFPIRSAVCVRTLFDEAYVYFDFGTLCVVYCIFFLFFGFSVGIYSIAKAWFEVTAAQCSVLSLLSNSIFSMKSQEGSVALLVSEAALFVPIRIREKTDVNNLQLISSAN